MSKDKSKQIKDLTLAIMDKIKKENLCVTSFEVSVDSKGDLVVKVDFS